LDFYHATHISLKFQPQGCSLRVPPRSGSTNGIMASQIVDQKWISRCTKHLGLPNA
jgi:hypothetical protein